MANKTFLFIDGTNLYAGQYELFGPNSYVNFTKFLGEIEKAIKVSFDKIYFYASYSPKSKRPTVKEKVYLKNEALFYRSVEQTKNVNFFKGYRSKTSGKEKEVDVKLTADLVSFAFLDKFSTIFLLTGDADFLQALFNIRKYHNKKCIYLICMQNKLMYKGAFHFKTHVICFKKNQIVFHQKQKINLVEINEENVVSLIK